MKQTSWKRSLAALAVTTALVGHVPAAFATGETTGGVIGTVSQASSALNGAKVLITSKATGLSREIVTDSNGKFRFPQLPLGEYTLSVFNAKGEKIGEQAVSVSLGGNAIADFDIAAQDSTERMEVVGARISKIDVSVVDSGLTMNEAAVDRMPVARNITSVALLAPGTVKGDSDFGNLPSFGGATVSENVYYLNGLNITDSRKGLGGSTVPFEFYKEFQLKTGGYSAEFGRSTGGVINAISKSGTNEFEASVDMHWEPAGLRDAKPNTKRADGSTYINYSKDTESRKELNLTVGGPIVQDKLFFFALYNPRNVNNPNWDLQKRRDRETDDAFWGGKLDWFITDEHHLEFTGFSDKRDTDYGDLYFRQDTVTKEYVLNELGSKFKDPVFTAGGKSYALKYTGQFGDSFTVSALLGKNEQNDTLVSRWDGYYAIQDYYTNLGSSFNTGEQALTAPERNRDERNVARLDFNWYVSDAHHLKFGLDREELNSMTDQKYSGPGAGAIYRYYYNRPGAPLRELRVYKRTLNGDYDTNSNAYYVEDEWQLTDELMLSLGLRNDHFENKNFHGQTFVDMDDQWAPRLGLSWDVGGDGDSKLYANYGRYYLPVATNTNVRLAGNELYTRERYRPTAFTINPDGTPNITGRPFSTTVYADGQVKDPLTIVDQKGLDPMYQDEYILGYGFELNDTWAMNVRGVYRDLKSTLEDMAVDHVLEQWALDNGITPGAHAFDSVNYLFGNPGKDLDFFFDFQDGHGLTPVHLSKELLGYPDSERKYKAIEVVLEHPWDGDWSLNASYTWSKSYGNNEGYVRSDNAQDDAGLTNLFDYPGLVEGAYGYLPNDRRHVLKLWGAKQVMDDLTASFNYTIQSGRPLNCFGNYPDDENPAYNYGADSFYCGGELVKRGSQGRTPWTRSLDIGLDYAMKVGGFDANVRLDIFNLFNDRKATELDEQGELDFDTEQNPNYRLPTDYQTPRYVRLSAGMKF